MTGLRKPSLVPAGATPENAELVEAFQNNDQAAIRRLGWWTPWQTVHNGWQPCPAREMVPYAYWLGGLDPDAVADAVRELAGDWRPRPAQVLAFLKQKKRKDAQANPGVSRDRAATPEALKATAAAVKAGAHICGCRAPTLGKWRAPTLGKWRVDRTGVLRCAQTPKPGDDRERFKAGCGGLEPGQVYAAEDAGYISSGTGIIEAAGHASIIEAGGGAHVA